MKPLLLPLLVFFLGVTNPLASATQAEVGFVPLFDGKSLKGWVLMDGRGPGYMVEDGILICQGEPFGYLYTEHDYESFQLVVEWRWPEEPGNSGVLMRVAVEPQMLPSSVEAQLQSGNAGDMYGFHDFVIGGDEERLSEIGVPGLRLAKIASNENEPGEWNRYEITVDGSNITLVVNGEIVNEATGVDVRPGKIALQSEGGVIHFRTVTLTPIEGG